ncbi:hypothetical protein M9435_005923 [Picochlorum sp. BPE23]|nr:hypothetical protein M9435_005923 [Picochlorum sp. BPE23]
MDRGGPPQSQPARQEQEQGSLFRSLGSPGVQQQPLAGSVGIPMFAHNNLNSNNMGPAPRPIMASDLERLARWEQAQSQNNPQLQVPHGMVRPPLPRPTLFSDERIMHDMMQRQGYRGDGMLGYPSPMQPNGERYARGPTPPQPPPQVRNYNPYPPGITMSREERGVPAPMTQQQASDAVIAESIAALLKSNVRLDDPHEGRSSRNKTEHSDDRNRFGQRGNALETPAANRKHHDHQDSEETHGESRKSDKPKHQYQQRQNRWVDIMDHRHDGRKPLASMTVVNDALLSMAEGLSPTEEDRMSWSTAFEFVEKRVKELLGNDVNAQLFGSTANGLCVRSSNDIDVSVQVTLPEGEEGEERKTALIESIGEMFEGLGMKDVLILGHARVPVVKFVYPLTGTHVDITINNTLACLNTRLLADYCAIDPRLSQLVLIVKNWAKKRQVNDPYQGTLSSYCYVLMCIFHLQTRSPPILPVLQEMPPTISQNVGEWEVKYFDAVSTLSQYGAKNTQSVAELVWEFFEYWAWRHDYSNSVISIRLGKSISKEEKGWTKRVGRDRHLLCVEDPFVLSHDLGRTVDRQSKDVLRKEFFRAATILRDYQDPHKYLFRAYIPRTTKPS